VLGFLDGCLITVQTCCLTNVAMHTNICKPSLAPISKKVGNELRITEGRVEDATGYPCGNEASGRCCDCGAHMCDSHAESCSLCNDLFCETCYAFHAREYHRKKATKPSASIGRPRDAVIFARIAVSQTPRSAQGLILGEHPPVGRLAPACLESPLQQVCALP
jgi:hypothetical protein